MNWGIIGCGKIAEKFVQDLRLVEHQVLYGVASRSKDKAQSFAKRNGAQKAYGDYESLCRDSEIDIIYLATPHNSHLEYGLMVMNHGKHLLCEKPLAVNQCQVEELIRASQVNEVFMMEAMWSRFNPIIRQTLELVKDGAIGEISYINADFCFYKEIELESRLFNPNLAGGALLDVGVYPIFLTYLLLGKPTEIVSKSILSEQGVDLQTSIIMQFERAQSIMNFGFLCDSKMTAKINGSLGSIELEDRWHESRGLSLKNWEGEKEVRLELKGKGYTYEILECVSCIKAKQKASKLWSHQDSLNLIKLCDWVRKDNSISYPFEQH